MTRWLLLLAWVCTTAAAQDYPTRTVRVIVPFPPGSTPDIVGRTLSAKLQEAFRQPVVVENRTGAGGNIGTEIVAKAPADGYTLLIGINGPIATNKYLYPGLGYDADKDLAPISLLASAPQMLVVIPELKLDSLRAFIDYARVNQILRDAKFRGYVSLEFEGKEAAATGVPKSLDILRRTFSA